MAAAQHTRTHRLTSRAGVRRRSPPVPLTLNKHVKEKIKLGGDRASRSRTLTVPGPAAGRAAGYAGGTRGPSRWHCPRHGLPPAQWTSAGPVTMCTAGWWPPDSCCPASHVLPLGAAAPPSPPRCHGGGPCPSALPFLSHRSWSQLVELLLMASWCMRVVPSMGPVPSVTGYPEVWPLCSLGPLPIGGRHSGPLAPAGFWPRSWALRQASTVCGPSCLIYIRVEKACPSRFISPGGAVTRADDSRRGSVRSPAPSACRQWLRCAPGPTHRNPGGPGAPGRGGGPRPENRCNKYELNAPLKSSAVAGLEWGFGSFTW